QESNKSLVEATESLERYTGQLEVLKERQKNSDATNERLEEDKNLTESRIDKITNQIKEIDVELSSFKEKQQVMLQEINQLESQLSNNEGSFEERIEGLKDQYYQLMTEQSDINNDIRFLEDKLATHQEKQSRLDGRQKEVYDHLQNVWKEKETVSKQLEQIETDLKEKTKKYKSKLEGRKKEIYDHLQNVWKEKETVSQQLEQIETDLKETTEKYKSDYAILKEKETEYKESESKLYQAYRYTEQMKT